MSEPRFHRISDSVSVADMVSREGLKEQFVVKRVDSGAELPVLQTGFRDCDGVMICVGDYIRMPVKSPFSRMHGEWTIYQVELRGLIPVLSYVISENGEIVPPGYLAQTLDELYDHKMLVFATDQGRDRLRPTEDEIVVVEPGSW